MLSEAMIAEGGAQVRSPSAGLLVSYYVYLSHHEKSIMIRSLLAFQCLHAVHLVTIFALPWEASTASPRKPDE